MNKRVLLGTTAVAAVARSFLGSGGTSSQIKQARPLGTGGSMHGTETIIDAGFTSQDLQGVKIGIEELPTMTRSGCMTNPMAIDADHNKMAAGAQTEVDDKVKSGCMTRPVAIHHGEMFLRGTTVHVGPSHYIIRDALGLDETDVGIA